MQIIIESIFSILQIFIARVFLGVKQRKVDKFPGREFINDFKAAAFETEARDSMLMIFSLTTHHRS